MSFLWLTVVRVWHHIMRTPQGQCGGKRQCQRAAILLGFGEHLWKRRYHSGVKSFSLWIAAAKCPFCRGQGEAVNAVDHEIRILKGKVSEKKARASISMLNSQVCPSAPDGRLSSEQGFTPAHGAPMGSPTALVRGSFQLCTTAHPQNVLFGIPSPKSGGAPRPSTPS